MSPLSFDEIYETHKQLVFNLSLQYVQHQEDAEEITQDVFVKVYQSLDQFKADSALTTWIYRITINTSLDFLKAKKRKKRWGIFTSIFHDNQVEIQHDGINFLHPGIELEHKEEVAKIFAAINSLAENQKTAIILSKLEQKSQQEIAEIMNLSPKAVESLIQRAKTNLQKKLN